MSTIFFNFNYNSDFFALVYFQRKVNIIFSLPRRNSSPFALFPRNRIDIVGTSREKIHVRTHTNL